MEYIHYTQTPLGGVLLASDGEALTGLWFEGQKHFAESLGKERAERDLPVFRETETWLAAYFAGEDPGFLPKLRPRGTAFQMRVWDLLLTVPFGKTVTYGELAARLGEGSPRAVGGAVGRNPISLLIPCHRVLGAGGCLTGYAGGLERKVFLLALEVTSKNASPALRRSFCPSLSCKNLKATKDSCVFCPSI